MPMLLLIVFYVIVDVFFPKFGFIRRTAGTTGGGGSINNIKESHGEVPPFFLYC
jgi:hypothetical protein